ncbi:MAG: hypothetical protein JXQ76_08410 [Campylobacterales bacterium]|nr:hypothetical protein [Campylobacterales bacterium]
MKRTASLVVSSIVLSNLVFAGGDFVEEIKPIEVTEVLASQYAVGLKLGTLGLGLDISQKVTDKLNVRFNINGATYSDSQCEGDVNYDYDLTLATVGLLVDYFPMQSNFRVSAGAYYNGNEFEINAKAANGFITINNVAYNATNYQVDGMVDFDEIAPYIGIGWGNTIKQKGWSFSVDAGVMYHGEPNVDLTPICLNGAACGTFTDNVNIEEVDLRDELKDYQFYPVVSVGVTYTF